MTIIKTEANFYRIESWNLTIPSKTPIVMYVAVPDPLGMIDVIEAFDKEFLTHEIKKIERVDLEVYIAGEPNDPA